MKIKIKTFAYLLSLALAALMGYQTLTPKFPDNEILLYPNQMRSDLTLTYLHAFKRAHHSILVIIYTLRDEEIIRSLRERGEEGIKVTVICDHKACLGVAKELGPDVRTVYCDHKGHMHQKIVVIDDELIWLGSANMTTESLRFHGNLVAGIKDPTLAKKITEHANLMTQDGIGDTDTPSLFTINGQTLSLTLLPDKGSALKELIALIDQAKTDIRVAMFTWTHPLLTDAVIRAVKRGVKVEAILDNTSSQGASRATFKALQASGCAVSTNDTAALLHHKFLVIDDKLLAMGSTNWTKAAFTRNNDCFIILPEMTDKQKKTIRRLWKVLKAESS